MILSYKKQAPMSCIIAVYFAAFAEIFCNLSNHDRQCFSECGFQLGIEVSGAALHCTNCSSDDILRCCI